MRALSPSLTALLIAAAASAAVLSHYVIDVVADYLVPHASFDDVTSHDSRGVIGAIAVIAAFALARRGFRLCCEAATNRGARATPPPSWWNGAFFVAVTVALACIAVPLMEIADARWGGADVDGCLAEILGRGYDGWIVVEQDQVLRPGRTFDDAVDSARRNRAWLSERGL